MAVGAAERPARLTRGDVRTIVLVLLHLLEVAGSELGAPELARAIASLEALLGAFNAIQDEE